MKTKVKKIGDRIINQLISPYNTIVKIGNALVFMGRGSFGCIHRCIFFPQIFTISTVVAKIGDFCQINSTSQILIGGEHINENVIINTFSESTHLLEYIKKKSAITTRNNGMVTIGSNVILSAGTTVLSGATVGDNVLIAAGSIVRGTVDDNTIAAGVPVKPIKSLAQPSLKWWTLVEEDIVKYFNDEDLNSPKKYQLSNFHLVFDAKINSEGKASNFELIGAMSSGKFIPIKDFSESHLTYFKDAKDNGEYMIISDEVFDDLL